MEVGDPRIRMEDARQGHGSVMAREEIVRQKKKKHKVDREDKGFGISKCSHVVERTRER